MNTQERRRLIAVFDNPDVRADYLVTLGGQLSVTGVTGKASVTLRYVPDRHVVDSAAWTRYLDAVSEPGIPSLEDAATLMLSDISDVAIPRWCALEASGALSDTGRHKVTVVDRQPEWEDKEGLIMFDRMNGNHP